MSFDIVTIGEPLYELNQQPDGRFLPGFGGDTSNVAAAAARLGCRTACITRLGTDLFGDAIMGLYERETIDTRFITRDPQAPTGLYFVTHTGQGHQFTYRRAGSAASRLAPEDIPPNLQTRFVHASGISQAISPSACAAVTRVFDLALKAGTRISYDTNFRAKLWTARDALPEIERSAASADILKTSSEDAAALLGMSEPRQIADHFLTLGSKAVLVTLGAAGVFAATPEKFQTLPGFKVEAVDATGAGDAFTGALLAECARGADLFSAARFANAAAALAAQGYGAIAPLPRRGEVEAFMAAREVAADPSASIATLISRDI